MARILPADVCEANASLIAAAPELLAALKQLILSVGSDEFALSKNQRDDMNRARVAILKAEGNL